MSGEPLDISCARTHAGWDCRVRVGAGADGTEHQVTVTERTRDELAPGASVEELVRASFAFLLEREPRTSILRAFDLPVIERYFAEYPAAMAEVFSRR
jgi:hypothetical protein